MIEVVLRKKLLKMEYLSVLEEMIFYVATRVCSEKNPNFPLQEFATPTRAPNFKVDVPLCNSL